MPDQIKVDLLAGHPLHRQPSAAEPRSTADMAPIFAHDQLPTELERPKRLRRKNPLKKIIISLSIAVVIIAAVFASSAVFSGETLIKNFSGLGLIGQVGNLIVSGDRQLKGEDTDRINFLLTGIGGKNHDGGTLTDTMILITYKPSTGKLAMISIPRDMYVKYSGYGWVKINAINAYSEMKNKGNGPAETAQFMGELLGTNIDYYAQIDFDGFEKLIDDFGGVDVVVDNELIDNAYPIRGREDAYPISSRFERLDIKKGLQHFDGATALKYARSRHGLGAEGSDFARSKRQQKILLALKDKIMSYNFLMNPTKISSLMDSYGQNVSTNLQLWEMLKLLKIAKNVDYEHPITYSLVDGSSPLLYDQIVNGAYVLLPYGGNYDKIKFVWDNIFTVGTSTLSIDKTKWTEFKETTSTAKIKASSTPTDLDALGRYSTATSTTLPEIGSNPSASAEPKSAASFKDENATIQILNGTNITGWSAKESAKLSALGLKVSGIGNASQRDYTATKIYDLSGGQNPLTAAKLQAVYGVRPATPPSTLKSAADFVIILGQ